MISKAYKFKLSCLLLIGEETIDISNYVSKIKVIKAFDKNYASTYIIDGTYPINTLTKLQKEDALVSISLDGYDMLSGSEDQTADLAFSDIYGLNKTIRPFNKEQNTFNYVNGNDPDNINIDNTTIEDVERQKNYSFCGLALEDMRINKTVVNISLNHATVQDAVLYIFNRAAYNLSLTDIKLNVEPIDNKTVYNNIVIPAINPIDAVRYLNDNYGLYNDGYRIFIDYPNIYITKATDISTENTKNITLDVLNNQEISSKYGTVSGYFLDENNDYTLVTSSLSFVKASGSTQEKIGENIIVSSYDEQLNGLTTFSSDDMKTIDNVPKEKHYWNGSGSPLISRQFVNVKRLYSLSFSWANTDPNLFVPNNKITVNDTHGSATGVYRNSTTSYVFSKNSNDNNMSILGNTKLVTKI